MNWTEEQYQEYMQRLGKGKPQAEPAPKKNKYNARRVWCDGIAFDSQKEADYYCTLKILNSIKEIDGFIYHGNIICTVGSDSKNRATLYETDFILLFPDGTYKIVDTKGVQTPQYKLKKKMIKEKYPDIIIHEE